MTQKSFIQKPHIAATGISTNFAASLTHTTCTDDTAATDEMTTRLSLTNSAESPVIWGAQSVWVEATKAYITSR